MTARTVAYQGQPGAFSHQACLTFLAGHDAVALPTFADVIAAVTRGDADLGVLPVENSCAGPVEEVHRLLADCDLAVVGQHSLPVRMHILAVPGTKLEDVALVVSHPIALLQCAETLKTLGLATEEALNTATAAKALAASGDKSRAVLASEAAADAYGLTILKRNVHDQPDNATSFCVLARKPA